MSEVRSGILCFCLLSLVFVGCIEAPPRLSNEEYLAKNNPAPPPLGDTGDAVEPPDATDTVLMDGRVEDTGGDVPPPPPDEGPPCIPEPDVGDWCDGLDNDCDGDTDEDGGPPEIVEEFLSPTGWVRTQGAGVQNHESGVVAFEGYHDQGDLVWLPTVAWKGDIELDVRLVIGELTPGAELYLGAWTGESPVPAPTGRTGVSIIYKAPNLVTARALVADEVVVELDAGPHEFLGVLLRITTSADQALLRLRRGDGSVVTEGVSDGLATLPSYGGLVLASSGAPLDAWVTRVSLGRGGKCTQSTAIACSTGAESCLPGEVCTVSICNPFYGCMNVPKTCPLETDCMGASTCEEDLCSDPVAKDDGSSCSDGPPCLTGTVCSGGQCGVGEGNGTPVICEAPGQCQEEGACSDVANVCLYPPKEEGVECDDSDLCTDADICTSGVCGGTPKICPESQVCQSISVCDPGSGECSEIQTLEDGTGCDDEDGCTVEDVCTEGVCGGIPNLCDDGLECTSDSCSEGICVHKSTLEACLSWEKDLESGAIRGPASYTGGAAFYVASDSVHAVAVATGDEVWKSEAVSKTTTPSVVVGGGGSRLYLGDTDAEGTARMVALSAADGSALWTHTVDGDCLPGSTDPCRVVSLPTEGHDGLVIVPTQGEGVLGLDTDGALQWQYPNARQPTTVVVTPPGHLLLGQGAGNGGVLSLNADGTLRWLYATDSDVQAAPIRIESNIYWIAGSRIGALAESSDEENLEPVEAWTVDVVLSFGNTQPVMTESGLLIAAAPTWIFAVDPAACDGTIENCLAWSTGVGDSSGIGLGLTALSDGTIAFRVDEGGLRIVDGATGALSWDLPVDGTSITVVTVLETSDDGIGRLVFGAEDGKIRALTYTPGIAPADSLWPVMNRYQHRNARL